MKKIQKKEDYIIAIGASAGGIEEIYRFFENTPVDGVSYVVIQHLSADFKSHMTELLDKHSVLEVEEAEEGMLVENNVIYLIPSDKSMTINNGLLHLKSKNEMQRPYNTVNIFFESLAKDKGDRAIGVILSGAGNDGTEGVINIKQGGGMVIASDPAYAEYRSMPENAIQTDMVDYILPPGKMPEIIMKYVKKTGAKLVSTEGELNDEKIAREIIDFLGNALPLDFSEYKITTILRRIQRRAANLKFGSLADYFNFLKATPDEADRLSKDFLISVTSFFRDPAAFSYLEKEIVPAILKNHIHGEEIKIWVPGCATGEEAYSLGMLIKEQLNAEHNIVKIFATDIDAAALSVAATGAYKSDIAKHITPERLERHFIREGESYRIKAGIRRMLIFSHHDLVKNPPFCNMDLISCRNLLIYLSVPLQKRIFSMLHFGLKKDGYLFLGSSENALQMPEGLLLINKDYKVFQNTSAKKTFQFDRLSLPTPFDLVSLPDKLADKNIQYIKQNLSGTINEAVMAELGYMVVCTDSKNNVVQVFGDSSKYLLQKNFISNITELLPEPLALAFKNASIDAVRTNNKVIVKGIPIESGGRMVTLLIKPLMVKNDGTQLIMSIFSDDNITPYREMTAELFDPAAFYDQYTVNVEEELTDVKEKLFITNEKMDSYKENMQSFNEELIAANEELQSANEEMQSVNEELHTINTAYLLKNKELSDVNDDLNNYFRSNLNGQLFINNDMLLMKFSPNTVRHINLKESDIGRPIQDITTNIKTDTLVEDLKNVLKDGAVISKESEATNGRWYQLMIVPYIRQEDEVRDGAIISFSDITELKKMQAQLQRLVDQREEFIGIASHELKTPLTSLLGYTQLLESLAVKDGRSEYQEFIKKIHSQANKITALVNVLLDVVKTEHDDLQLNITEFNVNDLIKDCVDNIHSSSPSQLIDIETERAFSIHADKGRIEQVFNNLLTNAIKFSTEHKVSVQVKQQNNFVLISVSDTGIGIAPEKIPLLFERFYRVNKVGNKQAGLGLGLYICKQIVELHKGKIEVESELGKGSTFKVYLPL